MKKNNILPTQPSRINIYITSHFLKFLKESKLENYFSLSSFMRYATVKAFREFRIKQKIENISIDLIKWEDMILNQFKRNIIIELGKEHKRKLFFKKRFISDFRNLVNNKFKLKEILHMITIYISESKTYIDNTETTKYLIKLQKTLKSNKKISPTLLKEYFDIQLIKIGEQEMYLNRIPHTKKTEK